MVAHLLVEAVPIATYLRAMIRKRSPDRVNQHFVDQAKDLPTSELIRVLESTIGHGWAATQLGSADALSLVSVTKGDHELRAPVRVSAPFAHLHEMLL